jgi:hypothetical protein
MRLAPSNLIAAALLAGAAGPAAAQACDPAGYQIEAPKGYSVAKIEYRQLGDQPVRATLWSERLGPRTTDHTVQDLPRGEWTPAVISDPAVMQVNHKPWRMGVEALWTDGENPAKPFECVAQELHPNGVDPWGFYLLNFIEREADPGRVDFQVRVTLQKGPLRPPPKPVRAKAAPAKATVKPPPPKRT